MAGEQGLSHTLTNVPTLYSDGVANLARGPGVVKFYLTRFDPNPAMADPALAGDNLPTIVGQVVMSATGFAASVLFFQKQLAEMVERGEVDRAAYAELIKASEKL